MLLLDSTFNSRVNALWCYVREKREKKSEAILSEN